MLTPPGLSLTRSFRYLGVSGALALALACGEPTPAPSGDGSSESSSSESSSSESSSGESPPATPVGTPPPAAPPVAERLKHGIDVSQHSGSVDFAVVAQDGYGFAFHKATEGVDLKDAAFEQSWAELEQAGLVRGAYHFYVTEDDPEEQAKFFIENVELGPGDLAPVVDVELIGHGTQPGLAERLQTFLDLLEAHYGVKPIIYTAPNFWDQHLTADFGAYPLWVAEYGVDEPRLPKGWTAWHLWQWRGDAPVAGVEKAADLSRGSTAVDLSALVVPHPTP